MPLARDVAIDQVALELAAEERCTMTARADKTDAAGRQALDRRNANLLGHASDDDHAFLKAQVEDAAHRRWLDGSSLLACSSK